MKGLDFNREWVVTKEGETGERQVNLPDDAMLYEDRSKNNPGKGAIGYFANGCYTYSKKLQAPIEWQGKTVIMECEGVYQNSKVLINGKEIYRRPYGYSNYFVNLSQELIYGAENEIQIIADNAKAPNSRWYSGSGVYREVKIYVGQEIAIAPEGVRITTLSSDSVKVDVEYRKLGLQTDEPVDVEIQIWDGDTQVAAAHENHSQIQIPNPVLWDEDNPHLYTCKAIISKDGQVLDESSERFGIRIMSWDGNGLHINGKEVLLRGSCIHHDNGVLGACGFADAEYRRVRIMKDAGFNAIRSAHNPISKAMLDACDELGIYVMDESFDMWFIQKNPYDYGGDTFRDNWKLDIESMVSKDYNHPSVIMYSIGNEISDLGKEEGANMCRDMAAYVKSLDSNRATTLGINIMLASLVAKGRGMYGNSGDDKKDEKENNKGSQSLDDTPTSDFFNMLMNKMGDMMEKATKGKGADKIVANVSKYLDMPGYNYAGARYYTEAKQYPDRAFTGSETLPKKLYTNWQMVKDIPNLTGDFMWTGWDYLGESGIGTVRYTDKSTKKPVEPGLIISGGPGVIDICGKPRAEVGWNKIIWDLDKTPVIAVEPMIHANHQRGISMWRNTDAVASWSWDGCEGYKNKVRVYAEGAKAELLVNGKSYGKKKIKEDIAEFKKVIYEPGKIETVIYDASGREINRSNMTTSKGDISIKVDVDYRGRNGKCNSLRANGQDLAFLNIALVGDDGIVRPAIDEKLQVKVTGSGTLQGYGSARPCMSENFYSDVHTTYLGQSLAVVRAGYEPGDINIEITGEGLQPVYVTIPVLND